MVSSNKITYKCNKNHESTLTTTSFQNKKSKYTSTPEMLCSSCNVKGTKQEDRFNDLAKEILDTTGHILLSLEKGRKISYECGNCKAHHTSTVSNMKRKGRTTSCLSCQNEPNKNTIDKIEQKFKELNINYEIQEYRNNKQIELKCEKGHLFTGVLHDIVERNRGCPECSSERRKQTNIQKYNHENVFQNEDIKKKIKETNLKKYGVEHHMQLEKMKEQVKKTCKEKYGVDFAFHTEQSFEKIYKTCEERYGVKFPLQSPVIQAKITHTFLLKIGVKRPMCDQDNWKQMMLEKYGSEFFIHSEAGKKMMMEKYGSEHAMQCPELFSKAIHSSFRRKEYKFPSGRIDYVLGYEPYCLNDLLKEYNEEDIITDPTIIPTFSYENKREDGSTYTSKYFPDILVVSDDRKFFIEVKSEWTWNKELEINKKKMEAVSSQNEEIEVWYYDKNGTCLSKDLYK